MTMIVVFALTTLLCATRPIVNGWSPTVRIDRLSHSTSQASTQTISTTTRLWSLPNPPSSSSSYVPGFDENDDEHGVDAERLSFQDRQDREQLENVFKLNNPASSQQSDGSEVSENHIPTNGVSLSDLMTDSEIDIFGTSVVPIESLPGVAQIVTKSTNYGSIEPIRHIVALSPPTESDDTIQPTGGSKSTASSSGASKSATQYVLVDVPPFSDELVTELKEFMGNADSEIVAMVSTGRDAIHYDDAVAMYTARQSDLWQWTNRFPQMRIIMYRLDTPRDCQEMVSQKLDGNGPWAFKEGNTEPKDGGNGNKDMPLFIETGRPLTEALWDEELFERITSEGVKPPRKEYNDDLYTPEAIRKREDGHRMLAVATPGHTYGAMSYVFPETGVVTSGATIPIESFSDDNKDFVDQVGPALDYRGYIANSFDVVLQMSSARKLVEVYSDRFEAVLSTKHDPFILRTRERKSILLEIIDHYDSIGRVYERLGITGEDDEEDDDEDDYESIRAGLQGGSQQP